MLWFSHYQKCTKLIIFIEFFARSAKEQLWIWHHLNVDYYLLLCFSVVLLHYQFVFFIQLKLELLRWNDEKYLFVKINICHIQLFYFLKRYIKNFNFHLLEVVSRCREPQPQVAENYSFLFI